VPKISSIEPQKKKKDRFNVYIDGKFSFGANAETILKYQIISGRELSTTKIDQIRKEEDVTKHFDATLNYLSYRPRSQKEVEDYLIKRISKKENIKFSQAKDSDIISEIVGKLKKYKYLNDIEFSKWWISSRSNSRPRGIIVIKSELIQKGINREIIEELLPGMKSQKSIALKAIEKKLNRWEKLSEVEFKKRVYSFLSMRGFDYDTIKEIVAQIRKKR